MFLGTILQINNLTKFYGDIVAVNNVSFKVESKSIFWDSWPKWKRKKTTTLGIIFRCYKS